MPIGEQRHAITEFGAIQGKHHARSAAAHGRATFGTGTSVMLNIGHTWRLSDAGAVSALAWVHEGKPTYAFEGLINYSAATIAWLKDQLGLIRSADETESLSRSVKDN